MLVIKYKKSGKCIADEDAEEWIDKVLRDYKIHEDKEWDTVIYVANELLITIFRVKIKEGRISHRDIIFKYPYRPDGVPNKNGMMVSHPISIEDQMLDRLILW